MGLRPEVGGILSDLEAARRKAMSAFTMYYDAGSKLHADYFRSMVGSIERAKTEIREFEREMENAKPSV